MKCGLMRKILTWKGIHVSALRSQTVSNGVSWMFTLATINLSRKELVRLIVSLTLLWYHEKSYVYSTMGSIWPHSKKPYIDTVYYNDLFPPKYYFTAQDCTQISTNRHEFVLGTFEYIEAETHTEILHFADNYLYYMLGKIGSVCSQAVINK